MNSPKRLNVSQRLKWGFTLLILIFILFGIYTIYHGLKVSRLTRTIYNHPLVVSNAALQANVMITKMHLNMKNLLLSSSPSKINDFLITMNDQENNTYQYLDIIREKILGREGLALETKTRKLLDDWQPIRKEVIGLIRRGDREAATSIAMGKGADHIAAIEKRMLGLVNYSRNKASEFMLENDKTHFTMNIIGVLFLLLGTLASIIVAVFTLKKTRSAEIELKDSEERLKTILKATPDPMVIYSNLGETEYLNPAFVNRFEWSFDELKGKHIPFVPDDQKHITLEKTKELFRSKNIVQFETKRLTKSKKRIDVIVSASCIKNQKNEISKSVVILKDITDQKHTEKQLESLNLRLEHEANHDPLTGALSRRAILDILDRELARAKRSDTYLCIGMCDIDYFKHVNDKYGHQAGDDVLSCFVKTIQDTLRTYDFLGRYGGEEFLMIIPDSLTSPEQGAYERVRKKIADRKMDTRSGKLSVTVSIGITTSNGSESANDVIAKADAALYRAKENGRNQLAFADDTNLNSL